MSLDPNRWTLKTQEAISAAIELTKARSNPEVTPDHLLLALLGQEEGVVLPIVQRLGLTPLAVRNQAEEAVAKLPKAYGGEARMGRELTEVLEQADQARQELTDEYLSSEHLLLARLPTIGEAIHELKLAGLRLVAADQEAPASAWESDLRGPLAVVVGSEGSGLSGATKRRCDLLVSFPMSGRVASLNAATAGSLLLFEVVRQRIGRGSG